MEEVRYTIPGDPTIRTGPKSLVGTRGWKVQQCQLVPEPKPRPVATIEQVQEEPEVTPRGPGRPRKPQGDADQA